MKHILKHIIGKSIKIATSIVIILTLCGCEEKDPFGWMIMDRAGADDVPVGFENIADYDIFVYSVMYPPMERPVYEESNVYYPDTSLPSLPPRLIYSIPQETRTRIYGSMLRDGYENHDTVSIFVFSADTLYKYEKNWSDIYTSYNILQRYDMSKEDFYNLSYYPTFPPTENMSNIKMWPPYGTYDSQGYKTK